MDFMDSVFVTNKLLSTIQDAGVDYKAEYGAGSPELAQPIRFYSNGF